ncbi:MAG: hypothetical protein IIV90_03360, partial [Oscillospiraceae bacterium]|nr:hypothetical protein [Oscillospiraceae bacterium]
TAQRAELLEEIKAGTLREDSLYLIENEGLFWELADYVQGSALCGRLQNGEHSWYVIAPGLTYSGSDFLPFSEDYPLHIEDYSDDNWLHGVLMWDNKTITFRDCAFTRRKLEKAETLICEGKEYPITAFSDKDAGWLMITLEIQDANLLIGKDLESVTP